MQTIYYRTEHFIRHQGNLVDLAAYRQKLSAVSGGDLAPVLEGLNAKIVTVKRDGVIIYEPGYIIRPADAGIPA